MCMVIPNTRTKRVLSAGGVSTRGNVARPTSHPSPANERPLAPEHTHSKYPPGQITCSEFPETSTDPRHSRHSRHSRHPPPSNQQTPSGECRVAPTTPRPTQSRIHAIDVPGAFHAYSHWWNPSITGENRIGAPTIYANGTRTIPPSLDFLLPPPVTVNTDKYNAKHLRYESKNDSRSRWWRRFCLIISLVVLCVYTYPFALSWYYIFYGRYILW